MSLELCYYKSQRYKASNIFCRTINTTSTVCQSQIVTLSLTSTTAVICKAVLRLCMSIGCLSHHAMIHCGLILHSLLFTKFCLVSCSLRFVLFLLICGFSVLSLLFSFPSHPNCHGRRMPVLEPGSAVGFFLLKGSLFFPLHCHREFAHRKADHCGPFYNIVGSLLYNMKHLFYSYIVLQLLYKKLNFKKIELVQL